MYKNKRNTLFISQDESMGARFGNNIGRNRVKMMVTEMAYCAPYL